MNNIKHTKNIRYAKGKLEYSLDYGLNDFITRTIYRDEDYEKSVQSLKRYLKMIHARFIRRIEGMEE